jgi:hypothetical protein
MLSLLFGPGASKCQYCSLNLVSYKVGIHDYLLDLDLKEVWF